MPLYEKYKPYHTKDLVLNDFEVKKIDDIVQSQNIPNLIITGPSGCGKTSTSNAIAHTIYGKYYDSSVVDLGTMNDRGVKFMKNDFIKLCKAQISHSEEDEGKYPKYKLIIFNECDNIIENIEDQINLNINMFRDKVRFVFTCNSLTNISESIQSKCMVWNYNYLEKNNALKFLNKICKEENILKKCEKVEQKYLDKILLKLYELSNYDLRATINKLEILTFNDVITYDDIDKFCFMPPEFVITDILKYLVKKDLKKVLKIVYELKQKSFSGYDILICMLLILMNSETSDWDLDFINDDTKHQFQKIISKGIFEVSSVIDSKVQISGIMVKLYNV